VNRSTILILLLLVGSRVGAWSFGDTVILENCQKFGVPFTVAERLIQSESGWNVWAVNPRDPSRGPWQLLDSNLHEFAKEYNEGRPINPFDFVTSTRVALAYLAHLHAELHESAYEWYGAVVAYKAGPANIATAPLATKRIAWWVAHGDTEQ